ncbi:xaa-Pro aminopeptidase 1-like isoform X1 [Lineus longissimus]|uniref:xaa-Pro aminopeptidase 1-like isoform X1 n=1 Tax=Lineus longissimus TaxID=88925 RepID=UPI002B4D3CF8
MVDFTAVGLLHCAIFITCLCKASPPVLRRPVEFGKRQRSRDERADDPTENGRQKRFLPIPRPQCEGKNVQITKAQNISMARVDMLREQMELQGLGAYMVTNKDAHSDEQLRPYDRRANYLSGYSSEESVLVIVTKMYSVFFAYGIPNADQQIPCNWQIRRPGSLSVGSFLSRIGEGGKVGFDPLALSYNDIQEYSSVLLDGGLIPVPVHENLVDVIRNETDPEPRTPLLVHDIKYAGRTWQSKVKQVRKEMKLRSDVSAVVLNTLDDIAWLFNLRGYDYEYSPTFLSFAIIELERIRLYIKNRVYKLTDDVVKHLNLSDDGKCKDPKSTYCVSVEEYGTFLEDVKRLSTDPEVQFVWIDAVNNAGIMLAIGEQKVHEELNPVSFMKCVKNEVEQAGMKKAYLRDAVAFVDFMSRLEREVKSGITWTEMTAAKELLKYRRRLPLNMGASFETVSAVGEHAAIIHYQVNNDSDKPITTEEVYLVDSGGQYLDGTIDVTRTLHFGTPSDIEIDTYTRILMGSIDVASTIFIPGTYGRELAFVARRYLWEGGYDFWHGVGHGIGHFLHIHEGPVNLDISLTDFINTRFFEEGIFQTIEPGYYRLGKFGIRLESVVMVTQAVNQTLADRDYTTHTQQFYRFETISFIPFEPKMINFKMLSPQQITWLNEYNRQCRFRIGTVLWNQGKKLAYDWLMTKTEPILEERNCQSSAASVFTRIFELCFILTWSLLAVL